MGAPKNLQHDDKSLTYKQRYELLVKLHNETVRMLNDDVHELERTIADRDEEIDGLISEMDEMHLEMNNSRE